MKKRKKYTEEFRRDAVKLMVNRGTRTVQEIARGVGVSPSMLHRWYQLYGEAVAAGQRRTATSQGADDTEAPRRRVRQLEEDNALPKHGLLREGEPVTAFQFIHAKTAFFLVAFACRALGVSRAYQRLKEPPPDRVRADDRLPGSIRDIHIEHTWRYGRPRVHQELRARGEFVGRKRVARLSEQSGASRSYPEPRPSPRSFDCAQSVGLGLRCEPLNQA